MKFTTNQLSLAAALITSLSFSSCSRYYYQPNSVNAPMLSEKGDFNAVVNGAFGSETVNSTTANSHVLSVQAAGSPAQHFGIIGSVTNYNYKITSNPNPSTGEVSAKANLAELGAGSYVEFLKKDNGVKLLADAYAGAGLASIKSDVNMDATRYFIQPGITFKSPYFDASFNMRFAGLQYRNFDANGHDENYLRNRNLISSDNVHIQDRFYVFAEPSVTLRGGYKFIKAQLQWTHASAISTVPWNYNGSLFTVGMVFSLEGLR